MEWDAWSHQVTICRNQWVKWTVTGLNVQEGKDENIKSVLNIIAIVIVIVIIWKNVQRCMSLFGDTFNVGINSFGCNEPKN